MIFSIIIFILTILFLVVIHELGHFLIAKKFGIKVEEFGFGIPPRAWGKKIGETIVSVNWLPFGGFVRLLGEDEVDKDILKNKRSFAAAHVGKRILVVVAGVVMNLILAWVLLYIVLGFSGFKTKIPLYFNHQFVGVNQKVESQVLVQSISKDSPAQISGIKIGETIMAVDDQPVSGSLDLLDKIKKLAGERVKLTLSGERGSFRSVLITPRKEPPKGEGPLGVGLLQIQIADLEYQNMWQKILSGPLHSVNLIAYSGRILGNFVGQAIQERNLTPLSSTVSGPVGITYVANIILTKSHNPVISYFDFMALLSLNLAVLNLLPFPALDGGRLFFLLIEAITRKRVHAQVEKWVHGVGFAILLTLMILVTFNDLSKILSGVY